VSITERGARTLTSFYIPAEEGGVVSRYGRFSSYMAIGSLAMALFAACDPDVKTDTRGIVASIELRSDGWTSVCLEGATGEGGDESNGSPCIAGEKKGGPDPVAGDCVRVLTDSGKMEIQVEPAAAC
jgi:hypothetical protein